MLVHGDFQWPSHCCGNNWLLYALFMAAVDSLLQIQNQFRNAIPELVLNLNQFL